MIKPDTLKLIKLIRKEPALYDATDSSYSSANERTKIWEKIAAEMQLTTVECKGRWFNIRDMYRKAKKTSQEYLFSKQLTFLDKHLWHSKRGRCATNVIEKRSQGKKAEEMTTGNEVNASTNMAEVDELDDELGKPVIINYDQPVASSTFANEYKSNDKLCDPLALVSSALVESTNNCSFVNSPNNEHHVDAFLHGIAPVLKQLTPVMLNLARSEIFSIVSKYDLERLQNLEMSEVGGSSVN